MLNNWFQHTHLAHLWVLFTLGIIPIMIWWYVYKSGKQRAFLPITTTKALTNIRTFKSSAYHLLFVLRCLAVVSIIIALARPQKIFSEQYKEGQAIDIMFCIDISPSMEALDMEPNRLEASKTMVESFVRSRVGDRMGVVVFSSYAFTLCPLTTDTSAVISQINSLHKGFFPDGTSLIGSGLATCINRLKNSKSKTKIIILHSDGVETPEAIDVETAIALAKEHSIKIYTIGIGSDKSVPVMLKYPFEKQEVLAYKNFGFNELLLKKASVETGGMYAYAFDKKAVAECYDEINRFEKSKIKTSAFKWFEDRYLPFLLAGFVFLFLEMLLRYSVLRKFP